jgi:hypothetical protein
MTNDELQMTREFPMANSKTCGASRVESEMDRRAGAESLEFRIYPATAG